VCRNNEQDTHEVEQDDAVIDEITIAELFAPPANCRRMGNRGGPAGWRMAAASYRDFSGKKQQRF
jgi:hypothetical protein